MSKQEIYTSILDKIIVQENESVGKKDFKSLNLQDFSEEELEFLKDFYPSISNCDKIDDEISRLRFLKTDPNNFLVKIKKMNLRELSIEIKTRKDTMEKIDNAFLFNNITDKDESDYWKAERELSILEKQMKTIIKGNSLERREKEKKNEQSKR